MMYVELTQRMAALPHRHRREAIEQTPTNLRGLYRTLFLRVPILPVSRLHSQQTSNAQEA